ncbi:hypothetical protein PX554_19470 [Sphingomonas sp. H39-1-10]|uniref:hypothetical protein n=1 Tax=Sphingomonas pollutisoli TaxID=3030829 RepID=UPI0023B9B8ED|nr:hypothetical protein [Sphingomonas pollutisoli]MDF0490310.1 hypothetical protein [Sphingomonas pollutisoli]
MALIFAEASTPGLDFGATKFILPMVLGSGLFTGLNALARNRRMPVANDARKAELLAFPPRSGAGWIVVMRDGRKAAGSIGFDVSVDDAVIAQLMPKRFTMMALPAGAHRLFADIPGNAGTSTVVPSEIDVVEGGITIFAIRTSMGLVRVSIRLDPVADTPEARAMLARMLLVEPDPAQP